MPMSLPALQALAAQCAPAVAIGTLLPLVQVESAADPWAIGVNGPWPRRLTLPSKTAAVAAARQLLAAGADLDLGLAQLNIRTVARLRLSLDDAFDPCRNLAASAQVLRADYVRAAPRAGADQAALRAALSLYNTGDLRRGLRNGYVAKVAAAAGVVPALQPVDASTSETTRPPGPVALKAAPAWAVFGPGAGADRFVFTPPIPGADR